jgi:hypothetical protein
MKITHTKKKGREWTIVLETEKEARNLFHVFGCRNSLQSCNEIDVRECKFQQEFYSQLCASGIRA